MATWYSGARGPIGLVVVSSDIQRTRVAGLVLNRLRGAVYESNLDQPCSHLSDASRRRAKRAGFVRGVIMAKRGRRVLDRSICPDKNARVGQTTRKRRKPRRKRRKKKSKRPTSRTAPSSRASTRSSWPSSTSTTTTSRNQASICPSMPRRRVHAASEVLRHRRKHHNNTGRSRARSGTRRSAR